MLILVTGLTGAGKTTYCHELVKENKFKSYSIDNWMKFLYWQDMPKGPDMSWFVENQKWYIERIQRCEDLITKEVKELFGNNMSILLDLGFTSKEHRKKYLELSKKFNEKVEIHHLEVDKKVRWERVQKRNSDKLDTYTMNVSREMFDYIESIFEEFDKDEKKYLKIIKRC